MKNSNAYRTQSLQNASGPQLVEACFREARVQLGLVRKHLEAGTTASTYEPLERTRKIYTHLYSTLDLEAGGELALRLQTLYVYVIETTLELSTTYDAAQLATLDTINTDMLNAWSQLARRDWSQAQAPTGPFQVSA